MPGKRVCFVIMPIKSPGSQDFDHYRALRDTVIEPVLRQFDYDVVRADDIHKPGAITADVLRYLANADIVIADLTDLNPNVFYELGVRHTLRGQGTIMIVDEARTDVPFDLRPYRFIPFRSDLPGVEKLRRSLLVFIDTLTAGSAEGPDNPVHDFLSSLPLNVIAHIEGSVDQELREELARTRDRVRFYESTYGTRESHSDALEQDPIATLQDALDEAKAGQLPVDLLHRATAAANEQNRVEFLATVRQLLVRRTDSLAPADYIRLATSAHALGLPEQVGIAIYTQGRKARPNDAGLARAQLAEFAHSEDPALRLKARVGFLDLIGIRVEDSGMVTLPPSLNDLERLNAIGVMLDAYHTDGLNREALAITTPLVEAFPHRTIVLRNHARALENAEEGDSAMEWYRQALLCPDADDTSAIWFANELHNRRRHVDALESYLLGCLYDPDDAKNFAFVANEIAFCLHQTQPALSPDQRALPHEIDASTAERAAIAAFSCPDFDQAAYSRLLAAILKAELAADLPDRLLSMRKRGVADGQDQVEPMMRATRVSFARKLYDVVASTLTKPGPSG